ncbi:unannotated protein [freshwater metagenome]|uniref:Unannotated protein n=1 Tax=freshwater metagenome TaxID=449393 RepID=A0A6J6MN40_9ZZZZ
MKVVAPEASAASFAPEIDPAITAATTQEAASAIWRRRFGIEGA